MKHVAKNSLAHISYGKHLEAKFIDYAYHQLLKVIPELFFIVIVSIYSHASTVEGYPLPSSRTHSWQYEIHY